MPFIGNTPNVNFTSFAKQNISGNGGGNYTLSHAVANENEIEVFVNNVRQEPGNGKAYTASGTALSMTGNVASSDTFYVVFLGKALQTTVTPDASVTSAKLVDNAVTTAKIASNAVNLTSKVTGVLPVANGGTGSSLGGNAPYWSGRLASNQTLPRVTFTTITGFSTNEIDSSSAFDGTTFTVPSGGAGTYFITGTIYFDWGAIGNDGEDQQTRLVHTPSGGSADTIAMGRYNTGATTNNHDMTQTATIIFPMGVGDTVVVRAFSADNNGGGGGVALANHTNFGGFRIGA